MKNTVSNRTTERRAATRSAVRHTAIFVVVCSVLAVLNVATSSYPWVLWVIGGWGLGVAVQWICTLLTDDGD